MKTVRLGLGFAAALLLSVAGTSTAGDNTTNTDPLAMLAFLLGTWDAGANTGVHGTGIGKTTFEPSLQGRVIVRTNHAEYPATGDRPGTKHDDLMVIYTAAGGGPEADFYDNEGHKIHYTIAASGESSLVFLGDIPAAGPRFRLTYTRQAKDIVAGHFEMAAPGTPDAFQTYLSWEMHRAFKAQTKP